MSLQELLQVEITGSTLTTESFKTVPSAVTVYTYSEIHRMGLDTLDELMNLVPGFQSSRSSFSSLAYPFSSRGRRIAQPSAEILVLVDGQRLQDPGTSGSAELIPKYPLINIERVEFMRGPGASVYGSNAMMGVINIISRSDENVLSASVGSFDRKQMYLQSSSSIGKAGIDVFAHFEADNGDNYNVQDTFSADRINTDDPRKLANLNIKAHWNNNQLHIQHNQFNSENFYEADGLSNDFNERDAMLSSIALQHDFSWQSVNSYARISYSRSELTLSAQLLPAGFFNDGNPPESSPLSNDPLLVSPSFGDFSETRVLIHNNWIINNKSDLQFGLELRRIDTEEVIAENNFDVGELANAINPVTYYDILQPTTSVQASSSRNIVGLYTQLQHQLFAKTQLTLGLRYDDFSHIGSQISPRIGIVQEINPQHNLKLLYGEAFRAPAENELNLQNNVRLLGNPDLKAETVRSLELIWVAQLQESGFSLGFFKNKFEDSIVQTITGNGQLQYTNADQQGSKGVEFEFSHELNAQWLIRASYTKFNELPELSFHESNQLASFIINYHYKKLNTNLIATYTDTREMATGGSEDNRIELEDYWLLFAKMNYNFAPQLQFYIQVKNLLDEDYSTPGANAVLTEGVANRGRELLTGVTWEF
ncbi:MAG: TonB-dependent receptor [Gammaproteobacteria bacterium]|nr:TonB-dependent receptor [Gammaproteobacteria bacterium]